MEGDRWEGGREVGRERDGGRERERAEIEGGRDCFEYDSLSLIFTSEHVVLLYFYLI